MTDWTSLSYVVVDIEGNGQQPPEMVELAAVSIRGGIIGKPASWLVRPDHPIKYFATQVHGLTTTDVADCPKLEQIAAEVQAALAADAVIAHNAHVDVGVLQHELTGWQPREVFDTLRLARRLVPDLDSYRLGNLVRRLQLAEGLPDGLRPHRATYDALVAARLFVHLAARAGSLEALRGIPPKGGDDAPGLF